MNELQSVYLNVFISTLNKSIKPELRLAKNEEIKKELLSEFRIKQNAEGRSVFIIPASKSINHKEEYVIFDLNEYDAL